MNCIYLLIKERIISIFQLNKKSAMLIIFLLQIWFEMIFLIPSLHTFGCYLKYKLAETSRMHAFWEIHLEDLRLGPLTQDSFLPLLERTDDSAAEIMSNAVFNTDFISWFSKVLIRQRKWKWLKWSVGNLKTPTLSGKYNCSRM